jgi:hypothetical protein
VTETTSKSQLCLILHHAIFNVPFLPFLTTWCSVFSSAQLSLRLFCWRSQKPQNTDHHQMAPLVNAIRVCWFRSETHHART